VFKIIHIFSLFVNIGCPISREAKQNHIPPYSQIGHSGPLVELLPFFYEMVAFRQPQCPAVKGFMS
jgi:hypothetical protein